MRLLVKSSLVLAASVAALLAQTPPATILECEMTNYVNYYDDVTDPLKMGTSPGVTPLVQGFNSTFKTMIGLGDITSINGKPVSGTWLFRALVLNLSRAPAPGRPIADVGRVAAYDMVADIFQANGTPVGAIMAAGLGGGAAPPGAPAAALASNLGVTSGTGAFLGARGQVAVMGASTTRSASVAEDPANRRLNGGGTLRMIVHLIPTTWPEVMTLPTGPAVYHAQDWSPVTVAKPAKAGEWLITSVSGLGPTKPSLDPGKPFPAYGEPLCLVNSLVEATVNGKPTQTFNAVGWPETVGIYRVDFLVPAEITPGTATVAISAAWIKGPEVKIPVQ